VSTEATAGTEAIPTELEEIVAEDADSTEEVSQLSKDTLFGILKNQRRRDALRYLRDNDGSADLGELAEHIAAKENDIDVRQLSSDQRKRVYIGLYQCHLPKMDDAGVVDFEKNRGDIELLDPAEQMYPYVEVGDGSDAGERSDGSFSGERFLLPAVAGLVVTAGLAGAPGIGAVPTPWLAGLSAVTLMAIAAVECVEEFVDRD